MNDDTPLETGEGEALPYRTTDHPPCSGINCGITRVDQQHSKECIAETALAQGWTDGAGVDLQVFAQVVLASVTKPTPTTTESALGLLNALEKHVDEYLAGYELCGDSGNYTPNDTERLLITDAIHGLLADDEFIGLFEAWRSEAGAFRALLVPPPGLTFGKVGKKMTFAVGTQSFVLDFEPEEPGEFEFMAMCLRKAFAALLAEQPTQAEVPSEREALRKIASAGLVESHPGHHNNALHVRCKSCMHRWCPSVEAPQHAEDCPAEIARAALATQQAGQGERAVEALRKIKLRICFMGWPAESYWNAGTADKPFWVPDWRYEAQLIDHVLHGTPITTPEKPSDTVPFNQLQKAATGQADDFDTYNSNGLAWAVSRWKDEVSQRPFLNVHRRTLDDTWRQVVRFFGGDPDALLGPAHDALVARQQHIGGNG